MLNLHCNSNDKNYLKTIMRPAERKPTIHGLKDHCATHFSTEFGAKN